MEGETLAAELRKRELVVLAVCPHRKAADVLVVYLHGNSGQWVGGAALEAVAEVPGVISVVESLASPSILLVRVDSVMGGDDVAPV